jgi:hypothetical protein
MKSFLCAILLIIVFMFTGCKTAEYEWPTICEDETIASESLIKMYIKNPKFTGKIVRLINYESVTKFKLHDKVEALDRINQFDMFIETPDISGHDLVMYGLSRFESFNKYFGAEFFILGEDILLLDVDIKLNECDREMLRRLSAKMRWDINTFVAD